jgi:hypothetical protein
MGSRRLVLITAGVAVLIGLFVLLRPDGDPSPTGTTSPSPEITSTAIPDVTPTGESPVPTSTPGQDAVEIEVEEGRVEGPDRITAALGDRVVFEVESDVADHVHVHTYDVLRDIPAGRKVTVSFEATIPGVFEIELEDAGLLLTRLEVTP